MISSEYTAYMGSKSFLIGLAIHLILMQLSLVGCGLRNVQLLEALREIERLGRRLGQRHGMSFPRNGFNTG
jgi:hypothetical protein